jgi:3-oxoadipate enol-lactonase
MVGSSQRRSLTAKAQVNGITLDYAISGAGRLIAFGHSLGASGRIFEPIRPTLENHGQVLTWDARGHGNSEKPVSGWTVEDLAADLRALIEHLGEDRAVVAGLSMGGNTAVVYAVAYPDTLDGLILVDTTAWYGEDAPEVWEQKALNAETEGMEPVLAANMSRWFSDSFPDEHPDRVEMVAEMVLANDPSCYAAAGRALGRFDAREGLSQIDCPTLILVGSEDPATPPAMAEYLHQNIANSELHVLPGLRHMTPVEAPDRVGRLMGDFLEKL